MRHRGAVAVVVMLLGCAAADAQDLQRGYRNYQEVLRGTKKLEQLSPEERSEVLAIYRKLSASREGGSSQCRDARERARSAADDLANYSRRLKICAESEDYSDDCSTEFRRVRNAHSYYESAVSDVGSHCR